MNAQDEEKPIVNGNFVAVSLINLLVMAAFYLLFAASGPYVVARFNAAPSTGGLAAGVMMLGCLAGRFVTGRFVDSIGFTRVLWAGLAVYAATAALYLIADNLPFFLCVRFAGGISVGCIGTATGAVVALLAPPGRLGTAISRFSLSTIIALALGPFLAIVLMTHANFTVIFLVCLIFGALAAAALAVTRLPDAPAAQDGEEEDAPASKGLAAYVDAKAAPLSLIALFAGLCYANVQAFLPFHAGELGLMDAAGAFFPLYAAVVFCSRPLTGKLFDSRGEHGIIYPALLLLAGGLFVLAGAGSSAEILLSAVLIGAGFGNFQSTSQAAVIKLVPRRRFAQATSTFYILLDLGVGLGPYLLGFAVPVYGYNGLFLITAGVAFCALPLYRLLHGRKNPGRGEAGGM